MNPAHVRTQPIMRPGLLYHRGISHAGISHAARCLFPLFQHEIGIEET
jgi:hypothetical protein